MVVIKVEFLGHFSDLCPGSVGTRFGQLTAIPNIGRARSEKTLLGGTVILSKTLGL